MGIQLTSVDNPARIARSHKTITWGMTRIERMIRPTNGMPHSRFWPSSGAIVMLTG